MMSDEGESESHHRTGWPGSVSTSSTPASACAPPREEGGGEGGRRPLRPLPQKMKHTCTCIDLSTQSSAGSFLFARSSRLGANASPEWPSVQQQHGKAVRERWRLRVLLLSRRRHGVTAWQRSNSTHTAARKQWRRSLRKMPDVSSAPIPRVPCSRKWRHRSPRRAPPRGAADSAPVALTRGRVGGLTLAPAPPALRSRDGVAERALLKQKCAPVRPPPSPVLRGDWRGPISFLAVLAACTHSAVRLLPCNDITAKEEVANQVRAPLPPPWSYTRARLGPSCEPARTHESGLSPSRDLRIVCRSASPSGTRSSSARS
jgi:hypothetical protein